MRCLQISSLSKPNLVPNPEMFTKKNIEQLLSFCHLYSENKTNWMLNQAKALCWRFTPALSVGNIPQWRSFMTWKPSVTAKERSSCKKLRICYWCWWKFHHFYQLICPRTLYTYHLIVNANVWRIKPCESTFPYWRLIFIHVIAWEAQFYLKFMTNVYHPPQHTPFPVLFPLPPLSSSPHGSTNVGGGLSGLHQSEPALYVKLCSPPIRSRVVLRALEFPARGGCSVWFIPVYSCLLCVAGDLTARTPTVARVHAHTQTRTHTHKTQACSRKLFMTALQTHWSTQASRDAGWSERVLRWQEASVQQGRPEILREYLKHKQ